MENLQQLVFVQTFGQNGSNKMSIDKRVLRINELAKKAKSVGLTEQEEIERANFRQDYIKGFRESLRQTLDNTYVMDEHGNKTPLNKK